MPDPRPHIEIYTDGGCSPNPGPGGWGAILIHPEKTKEFSGGEEHTTNNRMELTAAVKALEALNQPCVIEFYTDSEYLRRGITEWLAGWIANGWKRGKKPDAPPVANADVWKTLNMLIQPHEIHWHWVKGHAGDKYNERADELASAAIPRPAAPEAGDATQVYLRISGTQPRGAHGWAAAIVNGDNTETLTGYSPSDTANHFSLRAASAILEQLDPATPIQFYTNNSYLYDGITVWVNGWRKRGWTKPEKFKEDWQALDRLNQSRQIQWVRFGNRDAPEPFEALKDIVEQVRRNG